MTDISDSTASAPAAQHCRWHALGDARAVHAAAVARILATAEAAIAARGRFDLVLAGGETPRAVYRRLAEASADWARWHIYFGDERCLPATDPARNSRLAGDAWLDHGTIPAAQIHIIPAELGAAPAAEAYAATLRPVGDFDLVLLGLGEDGHTASLFSGQFPGHDCGTAPGAADVLAIHGAPKAPPERVSLAAARLSRARQVLFLVTGEAKHSALAAWRAGQTLPASHIAPAAGVDVLFEESQPRSPPLSVGNADE